ncbi:MmyB family transcriptional regulator [Streptomyces shenzhenensis]
MFDLAGVPVATAHVADLLLAHSEEFRTVWNDHEVGVSPDDGRRFIHPELGTLDLNCQLLVDPVQSHSLLVYTAIPGSESYEKLQLLPVIGAQPLR